MRWGMGLAWLAVVCMATAGSTGQTARAAAPAHRAEAQKLLYRWTFPQRGVRDWTTNKGVLRYDGSSSQSVLAPYTLKHMANFAVQAQIKTGGPGGPEATLSGYGLLLRKTAADPHSSISGGSYFSNVSDDNEPLLSWNDQTVGGDAFDPKTAWHLYRLEVHGDQYTLSIDGKPMVRYTITDYPYPTRVGVFSLYYKASVRNFAVYSLGAGSGKPASASPSLQGINLSLADLPPTGFYLPVLHHWYPNSELARVNGVSEASLDAAGRVISYGVEFSVSSRLYLDIYSSVTEFKTAEGARTYAASRAATIHDALAASPGVSQVQDLPDLQVGDVGRGFSAVLSSQGFTTRAAYFLFARGRYMVSLRVVFNSLDDVDPTTATGAMVDLAKILDGRMGAAG